MRKISVIMLGLVLMASNLWASGYLLPKWLTDLAELPRLEFGLSRAQITQRLVDAGWQEVAPSDTLNAKEFYWGVKAPPKDFSLMFNKDYLFLRERFSKFIEMKLTPVNQGMDTEKEDSSLIFANGYLLLRAQTFKELSMIVMSNEEETEELLEEEFTLLSDGEVIYFCIIGFNGNVSCAWQHKWLPITLDTLYHAQKRREGLPYTTITISME